MNPIFFNFPTDSPLGNNLIALLNAERGEFVLKAFPDQESYVRLSHPVKGRDVILNACLALPNTKILPLLFLADTLKAQGAKSVGLVSPYLPYMRQDKAFLPGEAITSRTFADLISHYFSYLITVDPHLHRYHHLGEIYSIPAIALQATPLLSAWVREHVPNPFLIGPDDESTQWVKTLAESSPFIILAKTRNTEGKVSIRWPKSLSLNERTPLLVDDIVSSGGTLLHTLEHLKGISAQPPVCLIIHPLFAGDSYQMLLKAGVEIIASCNSIPHPSNQIDLAPLIAPAIRAYLNRGEFTY